MDYKRLRPSQVLLDSENPRLPAGTVSDRDAINRLLDDGYEALLNLARDLVDRGESNPAELPIAIKKGAKYLVLEGNRRFAALKLLNDSNLADDPVRRAAFKRAAATGEVPKTIMTAIDTGRAEADHWIVLRHTGANDGVGVRRWNAAQTAEHRRRANVSVDSGTTRSMAIAAELEEAYALDPDLMEVIQRVRTDKLTNIGRFFATDVMNRFHLTVRESEIHARDRTLWSRHTADQMHDFFRWAMTTIDGNSVDAYKNATVRTLLIAEHEDVLPDDHDAAASPSRLADAPWLPAGTGAEDFTTEPADGGSSDDGMTDDNDTSETKDGSDSGTGSGSETGGPGSRGKNEAKPEQFLFQGLKMTNLPARFQFLLKEARSVAVEDSPGIACVMARVIVELAVSDPEVLRWTNTAETVSLPKKIKSALHAVDPKQEDKTLIQARHEVNNDALGIQYLHQFVHNPGVNPTASTARHFSLAFRPLLIAINRRAGETATGNGTAP